MNQLPGSTLLPDKSGLKIKGITTRQEVDLVEFENYTKAATKYLTRKPTQRMAPFTSRWMLKLHKEMLGQVWKWAGKPRTSEKNIGVKRHLIRIELEDLAKDIPFWDGDPLENASMIHYRAVHIHPFEDGNGRWARFMTNIWLRQQDTAMVVWPKAMQDTTSPIRNEYILAIKAADRQNYEPLIVLHQKYQQDIGQ